MLHLPNYSFSTSIIFSEIIFIFNQKPVVINKMTGIYSRNYNRYYSQYNIHLTTISYSFIDYFCLIIIFSDSYND